MSNFIMIRYLRGPNNFTSESRVSTAATFESAKSYNSGKCANAVLYKKIQPPKTECKHINEAIKQQSKYLHKTIVSSDS